MDKKWYKKDVSLSGVTDFLDDLSEHGVDTSQIKLIVTYDNAVTIYYYSYSEYGKTK